MQGAAGAGIAQARAKRAEKAFRQCIISIARTRPPDKCRDDDDVACNIRAIGDTRPEGGEQQAAGRGPYRARNVDAERVERNGAFDILALHQFRHDGLPGRPHERRPYPTQKGEANQCTHREQTSVRENHQTDADCRQQQLHGDQEFAPVQNIGEHAGRNGQKKDRQGACGLYHGDCRR